MTCGGWARWPSAALALLATASLARATTFYVRVGGHDGNDGLTPQTALASIRSATRLLHRPGDRIVVGPGTYREGNIQPRKDGRPDAPIVFSADTTGSLTGDPPGAVIVLPPNFKDSTTGFIVYGRHDVQIEGFEIDGARDAGIQVRPQPRTGIDSAEITLVNNSAGGNRVGIQVTAVETVTLLGNRLNANTVIGLAVTRGSSGALRVAIKDNLVEQTHGPGISISGASGSIAQNVLDANGRDLQIGDADGLTIRNNRLLGGHAGEISGANLEITGNLVEGSAVIGATTGQLTFSANRVAGGDFGILIGGGVAHVVVLENQFSRLYVVGGNTLDFERNDGVTLDAKDVGSITALDNRFDGSMRMFAAADVDIERNDCTDLSLQGQAARVNDNDLTGRAMVRANQAEVDDNRFAALVVEPPPVFAVQRGAVLGPYRVQDNVSRGLMKVGERIVDTVVVADNAVSGALKCAARHDLAIQRNDALGIGGVLGALDSRLVLAENNSHDSTAGSLVVVGAGTATVENNASSNSADSGLAVRRTKNAVISGNDFVANAAGGISILTPLAGDCNRDLQVTIDEIVTAVSVDLGRRPLEDCKAADVDGNGAVSIQEIILAVADALDPPELRGSSIDIDANRVERNGRFGIDVFALGSVAAADNRVVQNAGIPLAIYGGGAAEGIQVVDNVLGLGGAQGLLIDGVARASVRNNVIFSNREAGILLRDAPGTAVVNNLIYANGDNGIAVGLGGALPTVGAAVANNTLYGNAGWGIAIGSSATPSTGALIHDNIVQANVRGGIAASAGALLGLMLGFDLNDDRNGDGVSAADSDFSGDPQFVAPAGADGILGGTGFADDDFHVRPTSPAIDAGSAPAAALGITGSAVAERDADEGIVDLGYHYGALPQ